MLTCSQMSLHLPTALGRRALLGALVGCALVGAPSADAWARRVTRVEWVDVKGKGDDAARVSKQLEKLLIAASRKAKWGKGPELKLTARVTKLEWESSEDVLRVSVTVVANIRGGKGARSHIRIGGRPSKRRQLEEQALKVVADGLVTRLSDLARRQAAALAEEKERKKRDEET